MKFFINNLINVCRRSIEWNESSSVYFANNSMPFYSVLCLPSPVFNFCSFQVLLRSKNPFCVCLAFLLLLSSYESDITLGIDTISLIFISVIISFSLYIIVQKHFHKFWRLTPKKANIHINVLPQTYHQFYGLRFRPNSLLCLSSVDSTKTNESSVSSSRNSAE